MVRLYSHKENYGSLVCFVQTLFHPKPFPASFLLNCFEFGFMIMVVLQSLCPTSIVPHV